MFRQWHNHASLAVVLRPETPLALGSGRPSLDPVRPDAPCARTPTAWGEVPVLPGSSLKGVVRSFCEKLLTARGVRPPVCDPAGQRPCRGERYENVCAACRTFGGPRLAGRLWFADALPWRAGASAAERTAAAAAVLFDRRRSPSRASVEAVSAGTFHTTLTLRNFAFWQLGLLGRALQALNDGTLALGSGRGRGLGRVSASLELLTLEQFGDPEAGPCLAGVGTVGAGPEARRETLELPVAGESTGYSTCWKLAGADALALLSREELWAALPVSTEGAA